LKNPPSSTLARCVRDNDARRTIFLFGIQMLGVRISAAVILIAVSGFAQTPEQSSTEAPAKRPAPPGVWREVVTDRDGNVIVTRGKEITGNAAAAAASPELEPVEKAREIAWEFTDNLPDYTCEQRTLRYEAKSRPINWKLRDRVTADLVYIQGREHYVNLKVNNKLLKKGSPMDSGTWSYGEYGTIMIDVLAHNTAAQFKFVKKTGTGARSALLYTYSVAQPNSHWQVQFEGRGIKPAYEGQLWIDSETLRVLRVEMRAREVPEDYPMDVVETTVDYGSVSVGGRMVVLPVRAEVLACKRGLGACTRNTSEFRNYKKFTADSHVMAAESNIKFDGENEAGANTKRSPAPKDSPAPKKK
jgi:hypothetical protein